ncbi:MAG: hypothetical protein ACOX19_02165 [Fermentimonas sp.]|jgi:hypothetical protein
MIINKRIKAYALLKKKNYCHGGIVLDIEFKEKGEIMIVSQFNQGRVPFQWEQKWLAPGYSVLLTVE